MKGEKKSQWGDEAPGWEHILIVIAVVAVIIILSWITWFKFGWFH